MKNIVRELEATKRTIAVLSEKLLVVEAERDELAQRVAELDRMHSTAVDEANKLREDWLELTETRAPSAQVLADRLVAAENERDEWKARCFNSPVDAAQCESLHAEKVELEGVIEHLRRGLATEKALRETTEESLEQAREERDEARDIIREVDEYPSALRQIITERDELRAGRRCAAPTLIEEIGAPGPENVEYTAKRAVEALRKARAEGEANRVMIERIQTLMGVMKVWEEGDDLHDTIAGELDRLFANNHGYRAAMRSVASAFGASITDKDWGEMSDEAARIVARQLDAWVQANGKQDATSPDTSGVAAGSVDTIALKNTLCIVFDGNPQWGHAPRLVECEIGGRSVRAGEWHKREDGLWELRINPTIVHPAFASGDLAGSTLADGTDAPERVWCYPSDDDEEDAVTRWWSGEFDCDPHDPNGIAYIRTDVAERERDEAVKVALTKAADQAELWSDEYEDPYKTAKRRSAILDGKVEG